MSQIGKEILPFTAQAYNSGNGEFVEVFFFSSRRRHTRSKRDWSSDVCSSDLAQRVSTDKFTWSQGRFLWLLARAARLAPQELLSVDAQRMLDAARAGARFLLEHAVLPDATTRFVVGRWGGAPESTDQPERSVYADWFTVMGLSELARATGERHWLEAARPV